MSATPTVAEPLPGQDDTEVDSWARTAGLLTRDPQKRPTPVPSAAVRATVRAVCDAGLGSAQIGIDMNSTFLPWSIAEGIMNGLPDAGWHDLGSLVDDIRIIQSKAELALTRQAAEISGDGLSPDELAAALRAGRRLPVGYHRGHPGGLRVPDHRGSPPHATLSP